MKRKVNEIKSIRHMLECAVNDAPEHIAYMYKSGSDIISITNREFFDSCEALGAALTEDGYGSSHIACVGENSYPWIQAYLTVLMSAGVFVPLDRELPVESLVYLINESDTEVVFCDKKREELLKSKRDEMPLVKVFICFDGEEDEGEFLSFRRYLERGVSIDKAEYRSLKSDPYALKDLVFTSGTTGVAKGVMLSEHNLTSSVYYGMHVSKIYTRCLSVLPYNHTYEAVCDILVAIHSRATLCINDSLRRVQENMKLYKPDYIYLVPAFAEHFYNAIMRSLEKQGKTKLVFGMIKLTRLLRKVGIDLRHIVFKAIHEEFGGKLRKIVCGGAPIRPEIGEFFDGIGMPLTGGYGITECSPLVSVNDEKHNNFASAGHRLPCLEWRIDSPKDGIGEICVKGDVVMMGYYKRPDLTAEAIRDGWFYTGDYGYINSKDEIVITGRKKNIIVLNNGKNVYPEEIEGYISAALPYVTEVVVRGIKNAHGQDVGLAAEIYMQDQDGAEQLRSKATVAKDLQAALIHLPSYKRINLVTLRHEPFPKTTSNKIKRS